MGYKIAEEAIKRGHKVTLVSGPVKIDPPKTSRFVSIETAKDLLDSLKKEIRKADCLVMCAAVSDFKARHVSARKIKRQKRLIIELAQNKDILLKLSRFHQRKLFVGFSLETENMLQNAFMKLKHKNLDIIIANILTNKHNPFDDRKIDVSIIDKFKGITRIKAKNKAFISHVLLDKIEELWYLKRDIPRLRSGQEGQGGLS